MCDLWLGFGSPSTLSNWGCDANHVPIQPVCSWAGITCDSNNCGMVASMSSGGPSLRGTISSSIGQLTSLTSLNLTGSPQLHGTLPLSFNQLTSLRILNLSNNNLGGSIPDMFYNLRNISLLLLNNNLLTGYGPPSICALGNMKEISLNHNQLSCYPTCLLNAPNPGDTLPVADPNALIPGRGGATYGSKTGSLTNLAGKRLDPESSSSTCKGRK